MGLLSWILGRSKVDPSAQASGDPACKVTDLGSVEAGGFTVSATMTRYEGGHRREERDESSGWQMFPVPSRPKVQIHYQQQYRGRPDVRTVVYDLTVERVDTGAFGAFRLMGRARTNGKSYSGKVFPGNRIELIADENGEIIDDIAGWVESIAVPSPERLQFERAQGGELAFDPPVQLLLDWRSGDEGATDRYIAEVSVGDWRREDLGCRLLALARRIPSYPGQRAWAGR